MEYKIGREESERLNALKLWMSVLVVYLHAYPGGGRIAKLAQNAAGWKALQAGMFLFSHVIGSCAVPSFFLLAGMLLFRKKFTWTGNLRKKARTLLVPYLLLNTFWICFYFVFQHMPGLSAFFTNDARRISDWTLQNWINAYIGRNVNMVGAVQPFLSPLWFMRDLMVLNLIAPALRKLMERLPRLCLLALLGMNLLNINLHMFFLSQSSLVYFCLGWYVVRMDLHIEQVDRLPAWAMLIAYPASLALLILARNSPLNSAADMLTKALGILFVARLLTRSRSASLNERLNFFAGFSTSIYLFHQMNLRILRNLAVFLLPANAFSELLTYIFAPLMIIAFCIAVSVVLKKYQPRFYAVLVGGR